MRMLLKATIPTELGNRAIKDGSFAKVMEATMAKLKPEAAYFVAERGVAAPYFFSTCKTLRTSPLSPSHFSSGCTLKSSSFLS
jgi:hypothetical protein